MRFISIVILASYSFGATAASPSPDETLRQILTREQQESLKLTDFDEQQKITLLQALAAVYSAGRDKGIDEAKQLRTVPPVTRSVIESKIDGDFEGWEGETIFKLLNGQIWQQVEFAFHYHYSFMPDVIIYPSGSGFKMKVEGVDGAIGVVRLR